MEKAREFFTHTLRTPEAMKLLEGIEKPASLDEIISVYGDVARQLGVPLTQDEIKAYFEEKLNQPCAEGHVDDKEMAQVVGGGRCRSLYNDTWHCSNTFKDNENCWFNDACELMHHIYRGQECRYSYKDRENCWNNDACDDLFVTYRNYLCKRNSL